MLVIGDYNVMNVTGSEREFFTLELDGMSALLPRKGAEACRIGGSAKVFVFNNGPGELRGTFRKPYALLNETAYLMVKDVTKFGAFLDWGIEKDLFVPSRCIEEPLVPRSRTFVRVIPDPDGGGVIGDCRFLDYLSRDTSVLAPGEPVHLLVYESTRLGYNALINNQFTGLLYRTEVFREIRTGESCTGYVKQVREDGAVDLTLQRQGKGGILDAADTVLAALRERKGYLPLHDKSDADEVYRLLGLSKKAFKRGAGTLYKQKLITIDNDGIRLV